MFCPACASELPPGSRFCGMCGFRLDVEPDYPQEPEEPEEPILLTNPVRSGRHAIAGEPLSAVLSQSSDPALGMRGDPVVLRRPRAKTQELAPSARTSEGPVPDLEDTFDDAADDTAQGVSPAARRAAVEAAVASMPQDLDDRIAAALERSSPAMQAPPEPEPEQPEPEPEPARKAERGDPTRPMFPPPGDDRDAVANQAQRRRARTMELAKAVGRTQDERRFARVALSCEVSLTSETNFYQGLSENISEGGLFVATHDIKPIGTQMDVEFNLPELDRTCTVACEVCWHRPFNAANPDMIPGMGLRFVKITPNVQKTIEVFLSHRDSLFYDNDF